MAAIQTRIVAEARGDARRDRRRPLPIDTAVERPGAGPADARLHNISAGGFSCETDADLPPGTRVWLMLPGRRRARAIVVWARGRRIGAEFVDGIDVLAVLAATGRRAH